MVGKGKKRREKNYRASHGGYNRLPPPPSASSIDALPNKLRKIMAFAGSNAMDKGNNNVTTQRKSKRDDIASLIKPPSKSEVVNSSRNREEKSKMSGETVSTHANEEKKRKKRKRKQENDLWFEAELEKFGGISKRKQRKKEFLKAKKKQKKGKSEETLDLPKRDEVKFGDVVEAPPKLSAIPSAKKFLDASRERLRLQAIEAYRNSKGWTNRPGIQLPPKIFLFFVQKAELCSYRHEPTALGCETVCPDWKLKRCTRQHCNLRHMNLKKNRQEIPCYWETQPTGCLKPHCAFRHSLPRQNMVEIREDLMKSSQNCANNNSEMRSYYATNSSPLFPAYSHLSSMPYQNN